MCGHKRTPEGDVRGGERAQLGGVRQEGGTVQCSWTGLGGYVVQGDEGRVPVQVDGGGWSGGLEETGATAPEVLAGAPGGGQHTGHQDIEAYEAAGSAGTLVKM